MTKDDLINRVIQLIQGHKNIALQWATGLGKSRAALEMAQSLYKTSDFKILLIVAETAHKKNWEKEFNKWNKEALLLNTTIECYHSLKNHIDKTYDLIILDEGHHSGSELRLDYLSQIKTSNVIILSATLKEDHLEGLISVFGKTYIDTISLDTALKYKLLPEPVLYIVPLKLENITSIPGLLIEEWGKAGSKKKLIYCNYAQRWEYITNKTKYPNVRLEISCTQQEKYDYLCTQFEYYKKLYFRTGQPFVKNRWLLLGAYRKRFLGEAKTEKVLEIIEKIKDKRFICFCSSIEQAKIIGKENCIHSKKLNSQEIIDKFNNKEISNLFAVNMLQEGQNLEDIEVGIITQLDGEERSFIQKLGRSLRAEDPIQFILYFKNTRDEEWLQKNVLEEINPEYIYELTDISQLKL